VAFTALRAQRKAASAAIANTEEADEVRQARALQSAWEPFWMGCKAPWWECATLTLTLTLTLRRHGGNVQRRT